MSSKKAAAPAKPREVTVEAAKAFLGPTGWVQPGAKIKVTPGRRDDLARNGLIKGSAAGGGALDSQPLGSGSTRTRKLTVGAGASVQPKEG